MRRCTGLSNGTLSGYANSCRERRTGQDGQTDRQTDSGMSGQEDRQAGRLAGWQTGMPVGLGLLHANTMTKAVCVCVCACVPICVCALLAKNLLDSRKLNIVPAKWLNAFSLSSKSFKLLSCPSFYFSFYHLVLQPAVDA